MNHVCPNREKHTHIDENRDRDEQCMGMHEHMMCEFINIIGKTQSKLQHS